MMDCLPTERSDSTDPRTGCPVIQWTRTGPKNQHLYFTTPSVTADDRYLVFLSERTGHPNLYAIHRPDGSIRPLSSNRLGLLLSYVYPRGGSQGLSKASPCLDAVRNVVYWIENSAVWSARLDSPTAAPERLCSIPEAWVTAFTHVSADGRWLAVPCSSLEAFVDPADGQGEQMWRVMARFYGGRCRSRILRICTQTGRWETWASVPFWVTHVQFDPARSDRLIFNKEGHGYTIDQRIWCLEPDGSCRPLFRQADDEWTCHENFAPDGQSVVYHGARSGRHFMAARRWDGSCVREIGLDVPLDGHVTPGAAEAEFITDGLDGCISRVRIAEGRVCMALVCRHGSSAAEQDSHVHPLLTPDGLGVVFTSDRSGQCNVYEARLGSQPPGTAAGRAESGGRSADLEK